VSIRRIYKVVGNGQARLVNAASQAQAINFVVRDTYDAQVANQLDLVGLLGKGTKVEHVEEEQ